MKVLLISLSNLPTLQKRMYLLQQGLHEREVDVLTIGSSDLRIDFELGKENILVDAPETPRPSFGSANGLMSSLDNLTKIAEEFAPDVVHFINSHVWNYFLASRIRRALPKVRLVHTFHDPVGHEGDSVSRGVVLYHRLIQRKMDAVVVLSDAAKRQTEEILNPGCPVVQVAFGEKPWGGNPLPLADSRDVLIFGRINPYKGFKYFQSIAEAIYRIDSDIRVVIAGKASGDIDEAALTALSKVPNVALGERFIDDEEVDGYFKRARVVLMSYLSVTQSGVVLDSNSRGRPAVAFNIDHMGDYVPCAELRIKPFDVEAFAAKVVELANDDERLMALSECVWAFGRDRFDLGKMSSDLVRCYMSLYER